MFSRVLQAAAAFPGDLRHWELRELLHGVEASKSSKGERCSQNSLKELKEQSIAELFLLNLQVCFKNFPWRSRRASWRHLGLLVKPPPQAEQRNSKRSSKLLSFYLPLLLPSLALSSSLPLFLSLPFLDSLPTFVAGTATAWLHHGS